MEEIIALHEAELRALARLIYGDPDRSDLRKPAEQRPGPVLEVPHGVGDDTGRDIVLPFNAGAAEFHAV